MSVESRRVCTVKGKDSVHLWVNVSPTLGVVDCGSFVCPEAQSITHIYAAFSDVGARSDDSLLIGMNANWLFLYFDEGLYLWRLADGCLTKEESDGRLVGRLGLSEVGALWLFFGGNLLHSDLNKAILMKGNEVSSEILFVDLLRTFESKTLVIDKVLSTPPAAFDSIWINNTLHTVHLVMESPSMSPTLGVVDCGSFHCLSKPYDCSNIYAAFGDGNTFLMEGFVGEPDASYGQTVFVAGRNGLCVRTLAHFPTEDFELIGMNASWLIFHFESSVYLWRLADGCLTHDESDGIRLHLSRSGAWAFFIAGKLLHSDGNKAILMKGIASDDSTEVLIVDLPRSFESNALAIDKVISAPPAAYDFIWINNTLHTLHRCNVPPLWYLFNTNTKETVLNTSSVPVLHSLGPHHLFSESMSVFHSSDLINPRRLRHIPMCAYQVQLNPRNCGFVPFVVAVPTTGQRCTTTTATDTKKSHTHTSKCLLVDLCDTLSGIVLVQLHCQLR
ncbi:hypothetical protein Pelo_15090 [Pelomyxa schiedti]|nr:hypothetical protein Pelo_15090 [Pelomyxa schiedti]